MNQMNTVKTDLCTYAQMKLNNLDKSPIHNCQSTVSTLVTMANADSTASLKIAIENDIIDAGMISDSDAIAELNSKIKDLQSVDPNVVSKKALKRSKKAINRLSATIKNIKSSKNQWFLAPVRKTPKPINKPVLRNFLEELPELLGATDTPCEQFARKSQLAYNK